MKQEKQDRRSLRTRHLVNSALLKLLEEKRYDAITVGDLLKRAGISRTAFYSHYYDKEDVHTSLMEQQLEVLGTSLFPRDGKQAFVSSLELFRHVQERQQIFQAVVRGHAEERLWEEAQKMLSRSIEQTLTAGYAGKRSPVIPLEVAAQYLAGALLTLLKWWLSVSMPYSPEHMDEIFRQLALPGMRAMVEESR